MLSFTLEGLTNDLKQDLQETSSYPVSFMFPLQDPAIVNFKSFNVVKLYDSSNNNICTKHPTVSNQWTAICYSEGKKHSQ